MPKQSSETPITYWIPNPYGIEVASLSGIWWHKSSGKPTKYCQSCHGVEGLGDGERLEKLEVDVCDFSIAKFQSQPDGVIFYKITFGRTNMPRHSKKLPNDIDRWLLVNYIRTLSLTEIKKIQ